MIDRRDVGLAHVRAHRFARQQTDEALTLGVTDLRHASVRSWRRQTAGSYLLASVLLAGTGVLSLVRPAPDWQAASVLIETPSGAVFVNRDGVLHPALNLTSALLAAPGPVDTTPMEVSAADIAGAARGPTLGIAGAPTRLPSPGRAVPPVWSLCDRIDPTGGVVTTAVVGSALPGVPLGVDDAVLVDASPVRTAGSAGPAGSSTAAAGSSGAAEPGRQTAQLIGADGRLTVDRADLALVRALGISEQLPRPVSAAWAAVLPAGSTPAITAPVGAGESPTGLVVRDTTGAAVPVGALLRVTHADGDVTLYLLHRDGVEVVSPVAADLLRYRTAARLVTVDPQQMAGLPNTADRSTTADSLPVAVPRVLDATAAPTVCATWRTTGHDWQISVRTGPPPPAVPTPTATGQVDGVEIEGGSGVLVAGAAPDVTAPDVAAPTVGAPSTGESEPLLTYVDDLGIAYPLTRAAAVRLGLTTDTAPLPAVPVALLRALPPGPTLDVDAAGRNWHFEPPPTGAEEPSAATGP